MPQSLACGLPVVAANAGGPAEYVRHGETGYLVEPDDAETFAERLSSLLCDPGTLARFGRHSRESVLHLSPERIAMEFEMAYKNVIETM